MNHLSRRSFLRLLGVTVGSAALARDFTFTGAPVHSLTASVPQAITESAWRGRAFDFTPVYSAPSQSAPILRELWQNQIISIAPHNDDWFALTHVEQSAYVPRTAIQPLNGWHEPLDPPSALPFWGEVVEAAAYVMPYAAVQGTPRAQLGHGAVVPVIDHVKLTAMHDRGWYQLADADGVPLGWSQAHAWKPITPPTVTPAANVIIARDQISAQIDGQPLFTARTLFTPDLPRGTHTITARAISVNAEQPCAAWAITFADRRIIGVHWHNGGMDNARAGADSVHVSPLIARWLYTHAARVMVV